MTVKASPKSVVVTTTPAKVQDANVERKFLMLENKGADAIQVRFGSTFPGNQSEVQTLTFSAVPTAGLWRITHEGNETGDLAFDAANGVIEAALEGLASIGVGNVAVTGTYGAGIVLTYQGTKASLPIAEPLITVNTLVDDTVAADAEQELVSGGIPDVGDFKLKFGGETTGALAFDVAAAAMEVALELLGTITSVTVTGTMGAGYVVTFDGADGSQVKALLEVTDNTLLDTGGAVDAVQAIKTVGHPSAVPTAGAWQLVINSELTASLAFDANTAAIQAAIDALPSVTAGHITVAGDLPGEDLTLTFDGATVQATPQALVGVRNNELNHLEVPLDLTALETAAGLAGTPVSLTPQENTAGAPDGTADITVAETTPGSTDALDGMMLAGGERPDPFDSGAVPTDELWARVVAGGAPTTLEITTDDD